MKKYIVKSFTIVIGIWASSTIQGAPEIEIFSIEKLENQLN